MIRLAHIFKEHQADFFKAFGTQVLAEHLKAFAKIRDCRSSKSPRMQIECTNNNCHHQITLPHSCGNRLCPHCQNFETNSWIEKQMQKIVPANYFLITFTLPFQLRKMIWDRQRLIYSLFFECVKQVIETFTVNDKKLGGTPGAIAVLHTHSRKLDFHPHIHVLMPAAAINKKYGLWNNKTGHYLFNKNALAKVFRAKMLDAFRRNRIALPKSYPGKWIAHCKYAGKGKKALLYIARYLYRGVISEHNITAFNDGKVTFRYKPGGSNGFSYKTLPAEQFIWLIVQHTLPKGFRRVRYFGFLHPNCKRLWRIVQYIHHLKLPQVSCSRFKQKCPCCGAPLTVVQTGLPPLFRFADSG